MVAKKPHIYNVGEVVNDSLIILEQTRIGEYNKKSYIVQSLIYKDAPPYEVRECHLKNGVGCAYEKGLRVYEGNSLYNIEHIRKYLIDIEESKQLSQSSAKKVIVKCQNCSTEKKMIVHNLVRKGMHCLCDKGTPFPELYFSSYIKVFKLTFIPQQRFEDFKNFIFDFVNYEQRIIVETHGAQHYDKESIWYERSHKSDSAKRQYCKDNNWTLIELDCRESTFKFIMNSVNAEILLPDIEDKDIPHILETIDKNKRYNVKLIKKLYTENKLSTHQIAEILETTHFTIRNILHKQNVKLRESGTPKRKVRCIETGVIYDSARHAMKVTGVSNSNIGACANPNSKVKSAGKHSTTGEKLTWEYID